jgi:hypothetical protein
MAVGPVDLHGIVPGMTERAGFDVRVDVLRPEHLLTGEFIDAHSARTSTADGKKRQAIVPAIGPFNLEGPSLSESAKR